MLLYQAGYELIKISTYTRLVILILIILKQIVINIKFILCITTILLHYTSRYIIYMDGQDLTHRKLQIISLNLCTDKIWIILINMSMNSKNDEG